MQHIKWNLAFVLTTACQALLGAHTDCLTGGAAPTHRPDYVLAMAEEKHRRQCLKKKKPYKSLLQMREVRSLGWLLKRSPHSQVTLSHWREWAVRVQEKSPKNAQHMKNWKIERL